MSSEVSFRVTVSLDSMEQPTAARAPASASTPAPVPSQAMLDQPVQSQHGVKRDAEIKHGDESNKKQKCDTVLLEKGRIYFFYRPKVDPIDTPHTVKSLADIQKTDIILSPLESKSIEQRKQEEDIGGPGARISQHQQHESQPNGDQHTEEVKSEGVSNGSSHDHEGPVTKQQTEKMHSVHFPHRMIRVPKKRLPEVTGGFARPVFAYVEKTSSSLRELDSELSTHFYDTATRGTREQAAARLVASGVYELVRHHAPYNVETPTVLMYVIETPVGEMGEAQQLLNIKKQGQIMISVRNPDVPTNTQGNFVGLPEEQKPKYTKELKDLFAGVRVEQRRFIPLDPPDFLNYSGCELLLTPVYNTSDIVSEWGKIAEEMIEEAEAEKQEIVTSPVEKVAKELELGEKTDIDVNPAVTGKLE